MRNAEARRAVIAQVLAYASYLWGLEQRTLEQDVLYQHLRARGYESLAHAVEANNQEGSFDAETFSAGVTESLKQGHFRLVFILDEAPEELVRLVSYLGIFDGHGQAPTKGLLWGLSSSINRPYCTTLSTIWTCVSASKPF